MKSHANKLGLISFISATLLILATAQPNLVVLASQQPADVEIAGVFNIIYDDKPQYILTDNSGKSYSLDLDENLTEEQGGPLKLNRKDVVVSGILDPVTNTIEVITIELANEHDLASNNTSSQNLTEVKVTGVLNTIWPLMAPNDTGDHTIEPKYYLVDNSGKSYSLDLDENLTEEQGGPLKLNRKDVVVSGILDPVTNTIEVITIELADSPPVGVHRPTSSHLLGGHVSGPQKWAVILCRFGDATGVTPQPTTYFQNEMNFLDGYWRELSYDIINLGGSQVFGWYNLPNPRSTYIPAGGSADLVSLANDCTAAADPDIFFPDYMGIILAFNQDLDCCSWGGSLGLNRDGSVISYSMTWMATWGWSNANVMGHEMGHGFGLPHSSGSYGATYDSRWDVMSSWPTCPPTHPNFGCVGVHTIAFHKDALGWISGAQRYVATTAPDQSVYIERLALPATSGYLVAQIPIGGSTTNFYTIEARKLVGFDDNVPGNAIVIHKVDTTRGDRLAQVVDEDVSPNTNPNDAGAVWVPGEIFRDSANNIAVEVVEDTATGFRIIINPSNHPPVANDQSVDTNQNTPISITLSATDPDGDPIAYLIVTNPSQGNLNMFNPSTGTITYVPTASYFGPDSFTFKATDSRGADSNVGTVSIMIKGPPDCNNPTIVGNDNRNDIMQGTSGNDVIDGLGGNDIINGNGGNDEICGRNGNDTINSRDGNDRINGGAGNDIVNSRDGNDQLYGGEGNDIINGGSGNDLIDGGPDNDIGNAGPDADKCFNIETAANCEP